MQQMTPEHASAWLAMWCMKHRDDYLKVKAGRGPEVKLKKLAVVLHQAIVWDVIINDPDIMAVCPDLLIAFKDFVLLLMHAEGALTMVPLNEDGVPEGYRAPQELWDQLNDALSGG